MGVGVGEVGVGVGEVVVGVGLGGVCLRAGEVAGSPAVGAAWGSGCVLGFCCAGVPAGGRAVAEGVAMIASFRSASSEAKLLPTWTALVLPLLVRSPPGTVTPLACSAWVTASAVTCSSFSSSWSSVMSTRSVRSPVTCTSRTPATSCSVGTASSARRLASSRSDTFALAASSTTGMSLVLPVSTCGFTSCGRSDVMRLTASVRSRVASDMSVPYSNCTWMTDVLLLDVEVRVSTPSTPATAVSNFCVTSRSTMSGDAP